jgi:hypothetical protein
MLSPWADWPCWVNSPLMSEEGYHLNLWPIIKPTRERGLDVRNVYWPDVSLGMIRSLARLRYSMIESLN